MSLLGWLLAGTNEIGKVMTNILTVRMTPPSTVPVAGYVIWSIWFPG